MCDPLGSRERASDGCDVTTGQYQQEAALDAWSRTGFELCRSIRPVCARWRPRFEDLPLAADVQAEWLATLEPCRDLVGILFQAQVHLATAPKNTKADYSP